MPGGPSIDYRALVEFVAKSLAGKPDEVTVEAFERGGATVAIKVKLADEDIGRFIGKAGRNIEAIRTLVRVASSRDRGKRVFVDEDTLAAVTRGRHADQGADGLDVAAGLADEAADVLIGELDLDGHGRAASLERLDGDLVRLTRQRLGHELD